MDTMYAYRPLRGDVSEIRVLKTTSSTLIGHQHSVEYSLRHIALDSEQLAEYIAVSYCWGDGKKWTTMEIDGQTVNVPESSAVAIRNLCGTPGQNLWIDAICINQDDLREKSGQVTLMKEVYSKSQEVRIWLDIDDSGAMTAAVPSLVRIFEQCIRVVGGLDNLNSHLYGGLNGFRYSDDPLPQCCDWEAIKTFYSTAWFGRLWIIQESALAKKATCYFGQSSIDAETVFVAARWMVHRKYARYYGSSEIAGVENASNLYRPTNRLLSNSLRRYYRAQCSALHDKVYGLLGLVSPIVANSIVVDYSKPLVEVYAQTIRLAIAEAEDLTFLQLAKWYIDQKIPTTTLGSASEQTGQHCTALNSSFGPDWPSWVLKLHGEVDDEAGSCRNVLTFNRHDVRESFQVQTRILNTSLTLTLRGMTVGVITFDGPVFTGKLMKSHIQLAAAICLCLKQTNREQRFHHNLSAQNDLAFCLSCGSTGLNGDAEMDDGLLERFGLFVQWCNKIGCSSTGQPQNRMRRPSINHPGPSEDPPAYWHDLWGKAMNRRFFMTSTGMIGMAPSDVQRGDEVCVIFGSEVPFVLRPRGNSWKLVGDAYVRDMMNVCHPEEQMNQSRNG